MAIWHSNAAEGIHPACLAGLCPFCHSGLSNGGAVDRGAPMKNDTLKDQAVASICHMCGWWRLDQMAYAECGPDDPLTPNEDSQREFAAVATLKNLDLTLDSTPVDDIRRYLAARWSARGNLNPRLFEETVASVYQDLGYQARVTAYSGDGGIDVILGGPGGETVGVQVRRRADRIKVEQIRALLGALVLEGHRAGVFVTTSDFQAGCFVAAERATKKGLPVELVSGDQFFTELGIANLASWRDYDLTAQPFTDAPMQLVCYRAGACEEPYKYVWQPDERGDSTL
jgi:restriction system protein